MSAGAAGSLGVTRAVRSAADGYTLSIGTSTTHMLTGGLYALPFDLLKDLDPIIQIGSEPLLIVGKNGLPADDLKGLIAWLKQNPDKASVGIAGVGATGHLTGISFQKETGTRFQFMPYRGNGPAMQDLLSGQIDFMIEPASNFKALLGAGSVKPYAITGKARLPSSPNIATADEAGLPGFFASLWYGLWVPKDTPKDIVDKTERHHGAGAGRSPGAKAVCGARHPDHGARPAIAGSPAHVSEGRSRTLVADHQGVEHQGGLRRAALLLQELLAYFRPPTSEARKALISSRKRAEPGFTFEHDMVLALERNEAGAGYARGHPPAQFKGHPGIMTGMHDQRRHPDLG